MLNFRGARAPPPPRARAPPPPPPLPPPPRVVHAAPTTGSFATASCLQCKHRFPGSAIEADVFAARVPLCPLCTPAPAPAPEADVGAAADARKRPRDPNPVQREGPAEDPRERAEPKAKKGRGAKGEWEWDSGAEDEDDDEADEGRSEWEGKAVVKPDIVFFGEALSDEFDRHLLADRELVDLVIVMGTSLRVSPVAQLPSHLPHSVPQILINRDPVPHHNFDVCLLGEGDAVVRWLCDKLTTSASAGPGSGSSGAAGEEREREEEREEEARSWRLDERVPVPRRAPPAEQSAAVDSDSRPATTATAAPAAAAAAEPERVGHSHVWLFPGANRESRWVQSVRVAYGSEDEAGGDVDVDEEQEGEDAGVKEEGAEARGEEDHQGPVELPAGLAPGVVEGSPVPVPETIPESTEPAGPGYEADDADGKDSELRRIAPAFLHSVSDLGPTPDPGSGSGSGAGAGADRQ
ncbi:hypothetical protein JCM8202_005295 [Rhodotorula sphaerocarpa]